MKIAPIDSNTKERKDANSTLSIVSQNLLNEDEDKWLILHAKDKLIALSIQGTTTVIHPLY